MFQIRQLAHIDLLKYRTPTRIKTREGYQVHILALTILHPPDSQPTFQIREENSTVYHERIHCFALSILYQTTADSQNQRQQCNTICQ